MSESDKITHLKNLGEYQAFLPKNGLAVLDFHASWCGPCHMIAPTFEKLATENEGVGFAKVDVDVAEDIAQEFGIRAMPTFVFLKDGTKVDEVRGANQSALAAAVEKLKQ